LTANFPVFFTGKNEEMTCNSMKNKRKNGVFLKVIEYPKCGTKQLKWRILKNFQQFMREDHTCWNCGCEMDKFGTEIKNN